MAHLAEIDGSNNVTRVLVVNNQECLDENGDESEAVGIARCQELFGGTWVQTSYNKRIRKNYAGIGMTYDSSRDAFIPVKPYASWTLNESTCHWEAPVAFPNDGNNYEWDESTTSWKQV